MSSQNPTSVFEISKLGQLGDGLAETPDGMLAIPYTLAGEKVRAQVLPDKKGQGACVEILEASVHRAQPPCPHFGICGGCQLQHLDQETYAGFKKQKVMGAMQQQGLETSVVQEPIILPPQSRRRVALKALRSKTQMHLGYYERQSHRIVDVHVCPLVVPKIEALIGPLRQFLSDFLEVNQKFEIWVTHADQGLDVAFRYPKSVELSLDQRMDLTEFARSQNLCRLTIQAPKQNELIVCFQEPTVNFADVPVQIDASGFLQASVAADQVLAELVMGSRKEDVKYVADLFCGRGTLTLPLAQGAKVDGFEMDAGALQALEQAVRQFQKPVTLFERDLFNDPLLSKELKKYDMVVIDPPRAGAYQQCQQLAQSQVPQVVMVSCNPASFARDAKVLKEGGYTLKQVTPVDQFMWSSHVEVVGVFERV